MFYLLSSYLMTVLATLAKIFWSCIWHISFLPQVHHSCVRKACRTVPCSILTHRAAPPAADGFSVHWRLAVLVHPTAQLLQLVHWPGIYTCGWVNGFGCLFGVCVYTRDFRGKFCFTVSYSLKCLGRSLRYITLYLKDLPLEISL